MKTKELREFLDEVLKIGEIEDSSLNGLQVENSGEVTKVGLSVDASLNAFREARKRGVNFLIVHHGLFWGKPQPIRGSLYERIKELIKGNIALYAAHLPLDLHPEYGNNARAMKILGIKEVGDFGNYHGTVIGKDGVLDKPMKREEFSKHLCEKFGSDIKVWPFGPDEIKRIAYVSGDAISLLPEAIEKGYDAFVTGEPRHSYYWLAYEAGINVFFAGHYATERLGVLAIGELLKEKFGLPIEFLEFPTGH